ncbi:MAG: DUF5330 domain-containing protein [Pseudomonadota bacterium]
MKMLLKLVVVLVLLAALIPILRPNTPLSNVISAAFDDMSGFCTRQPDACARGAEIARDTAATLHHIITSVARETGSPQRLTADDRTLAPLSEAPASNAPTDATASPAL